MNCRDCGAELAPEYVREWFGGRVPVYFPLPPWCAACDEVRKARGARAQAWIDGGCLSPEPPPFPGARKPRPKPRICERCGGPGGRSYVGGWCGGCRSAALADRIDARRRNL